MRIARRACTFVVAAALGACAALIGPPESMRGDIPVRIINAAEGTICELHGRNGLYTSLKDSERGWLRSNIAPRQSQEFRLKAGSYSFSPQICSELGSRLSNTEDIRIDRATEIVFGDARIDEPVRPGFHRVKARFMGETCGSNGYNCGPNEPCCHDFRCMSDGHGGGICRLRK